MHRTRQDGDIVRLWGARRECSHVRRVDGYLWKGRHRWCGHCNIIGFKRWDGIPTKRIPRILVCWQAMISEISRNEPLNAFPLKLMLGLLRSTHKVARTPLKLKLHFLAFDEVRHREQNGGCEVPPAAFLLPFLTQWRDRNEPGPQALVLVPTRELVVQGAEEAKKLEKPAPMDVDIPQQPRVPLPSKEFVKQHDPNNNKRKAETPSEGPADEAKRQKKDNVASLTVSPPVTESAEDSESQLRGGGNAY